MPYIINNGNVVAINTDNKSKPLPYKMNDLNSVYTHWDNDLKCNVPTENKIGGVDNGKNCK